MEAINGSCLVKRGRDCTQSQCDLFTLIVRIGGPQLAHATHKALCLPLHSDWHRKMLGKILQLVMCPAKKHLTDSLSHNLKQHFGDGTANRHQHRSLCELTMDELAIEAGAGYCKHFNCVSGCCCEHGEFVGYEVFSEASLNKVVAAVAENKVHCNGERKASEAFVLSMQKPGEENCKAHPLLFFASCKNLTVGNYNAIFDTVIESWKELHEDSHGPIVAGYSDGNGTH